MASKSYHGVSVSPKTVLFGSEQVGMVYFDQATEKMSKIIISATNARDQMRFQRLYFLFSPTILEEFGQLQIPGLSR